MLQALGARVDGPQTVEFNGIKGLHLWPQIAWSPLFATSWDDLEQKVACSKVHIGADVALVISRGDVEIKNLDLHRGALLIGGGEADAADAAPAPGPVVVDGVRVDNAGWEWRALGPEDEGIAEEEAIRGFRVVRREQLALP